VSIRKLVVILACIAIGGLLGYFGKCAGGG
jgi:hypothetical protein